MDLIKTIIFVNESIDASFMKNQSETQNESKVFSFSNNSHKFLLERKIQHIIAENYLDEDERKKIFDIAVSFLDWYKKKPIFNKFEFEGINIFGLMDTMEFLGFLISELINLLTIKKIIEKEKPDKIITTNRFLKIIKSIINKNEIIVTVYGKNVTKNLHWDKVTLKHNIGKIPLSLNISRKNYIKIKNLWENIVCSVLGLWFDFKNHDKKTILFLEFYPPAYENLISYINKDNTNIIFLNRRRPAVYDRLSLNILRKFNCKLVNLQKILSKNEQNKITNQSRMFIEELDKIKFDDDAFSNLFLLESKPIWPLICNVLIDTYKNRLIEYLTLILTAKKILEKINVRCIISLYESGETEKAILNANKKNITSILLEHGFSYLSPETARYGIQNSYPNFRDKVAVWSNFQKKNIHEQLDKENDRILVSGSPRHDQFFKKTITEKINPQKIVLIAPTPINQNHGNDHTNIHIKFEKLLKELCLIIKEMNMKIIVKIHPSQYEHNNEIIKIIKKIDPQIPVYLFRPVLEVIDLCDSVITITPEGFAPSTIILESLIRNKPTMNIILDNHFYDFPYVKDNAILTISDEVDLRKNLSDLLINEDLRTRLKNNGKNSIENFFANPGTSSKHLADIINSYL